MAEIKAYSEMERESEVEGDEESEICEESESEQKPEASNALGVAFNLGNSMIGGGISMVALPLACQKTGLALWPILTMAIMLVSCYTADLLVCSSMETHKTSFSGLLGHVAGFGAERCMDVVLFVNNISCCVTFLQTFEAVMGPLLTIPPLVWPLGGAAASLIFLLFAKDINSLIPLSKFAVLQVLLFAILVVSCTTELPKKLPQVSITLWPESSANFLKGLSMTVWSMCCQYNVLPVFTGVREPARRKKWLFALSLGTGVPCALYLLFGMLGYLIHPHTEGDILVDFSRFFLGRVLAVVMAVGLVASFPLLEWEAAHCLVRFASNVCGCTFHDDNGSDTENHAKRELSGDDTDTSSTGECFDSPKANVSMSAAHCVGTFIAAFIAVCVKDVGRVIELIGALIAVPLMLVLPPIIFMSVGIDSEGCYIYDRWCTRLTLVLGLVLTAACTYNWFTEE